MWDDWNFEVKVLGKGKKRLAAAVSLFFDKDLQNKDDVVKNPEKEEFTHWAKFTKNDTTYLCLLRNFSEKELILWEEDKHMVKSNVLPLPFKMDEKATTEFLWNWFKGLEKEEWGPEPNCDGSVSRECFCIETETAYFMNTVLLIHPVWAEYHK